MKTMKAENKEAHGESEGKAEEASGFFTPNEMIDFSGVKIEPLFEDQVDFETFSKSDFKRYPRLLRAGRADRKDPDCNHEPAAAPHDGHRVLRHVALCGQ